MNTWQRDGGSMCIGGGEGSNELLRLTCCLSSLENLFAWFVLHFVIRPTCQDQVRDSKISMHIVVPVDRP